MARKEVLHNGVRYDLEEFKSRGEKAAPVDNEKVLLVDVEGKKKSGDKSGVEGSAPVTVSSEIEAPKSRRSKK